MPKPPRPDKLPGPIRYKKPTGKPEDRPLERIRQEFEDHKRARKGDEPRSGRGVGAGRSKAKRPVGRSKAKRPVGRSKTKRPVGRSKTKRRPRRGARRKAAR
jgi:hypothetical protein